MAPTRDLPETPQTYWRWGIPSLVLAIVTAFLLITSQFVIEPGILTRYENLVSEVRTQAVNDQPLNASNTELSKALERTRKAELAAQRLMVRHPDQSKYRRWHAEVCTIVSGIAARLAESDTNGSTQQHEHWDQLANDFRMRGLESMRSASQLKGLDAGWAQAVLLREDLLRVRQICRDDTRQISALIERYDRIDQESDRKGVVFGTGSLAIQLGHRVSPAWDPRERAETLRLGVEGLRASLSRSVGEQEGSLEGLVASAWLAEGLASIEPEQAIRIARDAIIGNSDRMQRLSPAISAARRIEAIDAFFRCLLLVSGVEEATASVLSRMDQIPLQDRPLLSHVVVSSHLRALVSRLAYPEGAFGSVSVGHALQSALRIGGDHPELVSLLDGFFIEPSDQFNFLQGLFDRQDARKNDLFLEKMDWMRRVLRGTQGQQAGSIQAGPVWSERELEGAVVLMAYWVQAAGRHRLEWGQVGPIVDGMVQAYPQSGDLRLGRAVIALGFERWDLAVEELEKIHQRNPEHMGVERLLKQARDRSGVGSIKNESTQEEPR
jgi:hypothetical protein